MYKASSMITLLPIVVSVLAVCIIVSAVDIRTPLEKDAADRMSRFPMIMLWAWERPEDLSFIDPEKVGVAFLAGTLYLQDDDVLARPRLQPLKAPDGTKLMAVIRIESARSKTSSLSSEQRMRAVSEICDQVDMPDVAGVQIDFDANASQRDFYRDLLSELRNKLPDSMTLSITALASWCIHDDWLSGLPVDEAVPMLFRMGPDRQQILLYLKRGGDFRLSFCKSSLGISTDEPVSALPPGRRVYIFHPEAWSAEAARSVIEEVESWQ